MLGWPLQAKWSQRNWSLITNSKLRSGAWVMAT